MIHFIQKLCRGLCRIGCSIIGNLKVIFTIDNAKDVARFWCGVVKDIPFAYKALYYKIFGDTENKQSPIKKRALRIAGENIDNKVYVRTMTGTFIMGILLGIYFPILVVLFLPSWSLITAIIILTFIMPVILYQLTQLHLGYMGERVVGEQIEQIARDKQWGVFHSFSLGEGKSDIDHIIVCPKGIFCVETKTLRKPRQDAKQLSLANGRILEGQKPLPRNPVGQAKGNARDLRELLEKEVKLDDGETIPFVIPVLVFPGRSVEEQHDDKNMIICNHERLSDIIAKKNDGVQLSDSLINKICGVLKQYNRPTSFD